MGIKEAKQSTQLPQCVLEGGACEEQTELGGEIRESYEQLRGFILETVGFIYNENFPFKGLKEAGLLP